MIAIWRQLWQQVEIYIDGKLLGDIKLTKIDEKGAHLAFNIPPNVTIVPKELPPSEEKQKLLKRK